MMKRAYLLSMRIPFDLRLQSNHDLLVNPKTGERVSCRAYAVVDQFQRENCVQQYEWLGFVQAQNLTPEQRDNLPAKPTR
jgi:hypothetical protein